MTTHSEITGCITQKLVSEKIDAAPDSFKLLVIRTAIHDLLYAVFFTSVDKTFDICLCNIFKNMFINVHLICKYCN